MSELKIITDISQYKENLERIYEESIEYFMEVEGRRPLSPFDDIHSIEPGIPQQNPIQCYAFLFEGQIVGYSWVMEDISDECYYILHFIITNNFRRHKFGTKVLKALDNIYKEKYDKSELLVSSKNYTGLNFWVKNGYTEITRVFSSEEQNTISTELNLRKKICR